MRSSAALLSLWVLAGCQINGSVTPPLPSGPPPTCDSSTASSSTAPFSFGGSGGCIDQVTQSLEALATALRFSDRYETQRVLNTNSGRLMDSYSLAAGRFEYAHALDMTGAGQIIMIRDDGFDMTHDEFGGKTILYEGGRSASTVTIAAHGTAVASLAAGSASFGTSIGAAPDATLLVSSWTDERSDATAVRAAKTAGAVVMNNSWGYTCAGDPFNECGINDYGVSFLPFATRSAFLDYAGDEGVVVFSISNEETQTQATYMAALPMHFPALEEGWLAVINLSRDFDESITDHFTDGASGVALISSGCMEAARWCIAADGTSTIALANDTNGYTTGTGTSYAAPRVSGAVAILAQAFPTLSVSELRNRLLVTADNGFFTAGDPLIQTMTFAEGFTHDYHWDYGHGFVDLRAALLPIGALSTRASRGTEVSLEAPLLVSGSGVGAAPRAALAQITLAARDQLGGMFGADASQFAARTIDDRSHLAGLSALSQRNLAVERTAGRNLEDAVFDQGKTVSLQVTPELVLDTRLPVTDTDMVAARLTYEGDYLGGDLSLGVSHLQASSDPIGLSQIAGNNVASDASALQLGWSTNLSDQLSFNLNAMAGLSRPNAGSDFVQLNEVGYSDLGFGITRSGLLRDGDRISLTFRQPLAATDGAARLQLETLDDSGKATLSDIHIDLAPGAREYEIGVEYQTRGPFGTEWQFSATHTENAGHSAGQSAVNIDAAVQLRF